MGRGRLSGLAELLASAGVPVRRRGFGCLAMTVPPSASESSLSSISTGAGAEARPRSPARFGDCAGVGFFRGEVRGGAGVESGREEEG